MAASDIVRLGMFGSDAFVTVAASWLMVCASGHAGRGALEPLGAWLLAFVALIAGAGVILGELGGFGPHGFLGVHTAILVGLGVLRRRTLRADIAASYHALKDVGRTLARGGSHRLLALGIVISAGTLALIAACAEPAVVDALTYRLPRLAHWLEQGRIDAIPSADARMTFVAGLWEIVAAWFLGATAEGFHLVILTQAMGGLLALAATIGIARGTGLGHGTALLAAVLLLGMANVAVQFTAAQTDLFTTGTFAAGFYLWLAAYQRGRISMLGLIGVGVAFGAKGTVFYLAPGALIWVGWLAWKQPPARPALWLHMTLVAAVSIAFFAGPGFVRNWRTYGAMLGPAEWVEKHHRGLAPHVGLASKLRWNLTASFAQNLEPHSQPAPLREFARAAGVQLAASLPEADPYTLAGLNRRETLQQQILSRREPDADVTAFGIVALGLFSAGIVVVILRRREPMSPLVLVWAAGVASFFVFFHGMHQWHPFAFRYLALAAPWIAVVAAAGLASLSGAWRIASWAAVLLASGQVAAHVTLNTHQAGWRAIVQPERSLGYFVARGWRAWSKQLEGPLTIALPEERPVAAFHRQRPARTITYQPQPDVTISSAEALAERVPGWVIVSAGQFLGREGRVAARIWLFDGSEASPFSIAAYRKLRPGEQPSPVLYRHLRTARGAEVHHDLLVKTWSAEPTRFALRNPHDIELHVLLVTPAERTKASLAPRSTTVIDVALPADAVAELRLVLQTPEPTDAAAVMSVELLLPSS